MTTIRKILIPTFGDADTLQIVHEAIPPPPPSHIQVTVLYAGFSGADIAMRRGLYPMQRPAPLTPGYCLIGRIATRNPNCTSNFQPGDLVASLTTYDAQAERVNLPEKYLIPVPAGLDLPQATALVLDWNTAWGMVKQTARVSAGQSVFIHGISGAVGYATMKLCLMMGATKVYGTASERNHATIRREGGDPFVYTDKRWVEEMKEIGGVQAVFDPLGFESFDESFSILADKGGVLVGYGGNQQILDADAPPRTPILPMAKLMLRNLNVFSGKRTKFYVISKDSRDFVGNLKELFGFLAEGEIEVPIKKIWEMEEVQEAHQAWGKGGGVGSFVMRISRE